MKEYKVNRDKKKLNKEEALKRKDFAQLKTNYNDALERLHKKPVYKDPKMFFILLIIVFLAWLISTLS